MKRYRLIYRGNRDAYYCFDTLTKKRESLGINHAGEAQRLVDARNEAVRHVAMNLQIAQVYLQHSDPTLATRTWQSVMDAMGPLKTGPTQSRWTSAMRDKAFDLIRNRKLIETTSEHFLQVLNAGTVSTNMFLRRLHNYATGMHWLPWPVLPKRRWPAVKHKERRAITAEEHQTIIEREHNPEIRAYYQFLWHLGGSQTDIAELTAEDIDWSDRTISYRRNKTEHARRHHFWRGVPRQILPGTAEIRPIVPAHGSNQGEPSRKDVYQTAQDRRRLREGFQSACVQKSV